MFIPGGAVDRANVVANDQELPEMKVAQPPSPWGETGFFSNADSWWIFLGEVGFLCY